MSRRNVETLKRIYDRWTRDRSIDSHEFDPEFEMRTPIIVHGCTAMPFARASAATQTLRRLLA